MERADQIEDENSDKILNIEIEILQAFLCVVIFLGICVSY